MTEGLDKILLNAIERTFGGEGLCEREALEFVNISEERIFDILPHTDRLRQRFKGMEVDLCGIVNAKSGSCSEDCSFCSQSIHYDAGVENYPMLEAERIKDAAKEARERGAREFSIVTSGAAVESDTEVTILGEAVSAIRRDAGMESCASLGSVSKETLLKLKSKGLESYHHNLETSRNFFPSVCSTHEYDEDVATVRAAKEAGLYVCSGGVFGLGEEWADRVELSLTLRELQVDSIPINFLNPRPGTPLEEADNLTPRECLKIISLFRLMHPTKDIVVCGGRPTNLRDLQPLIFAAGANGMMIGDYLTTPGRNSDDDLRMLRDLGLSPRGE